MSMASCSSFSTADTDIHPDIIRTHLLTRLDGQSLASFSCVSSHLHSICAEESLWKTLCNSKWPSTKDARVQEIISAFPSGHRSFFSDSYQTIRLLHYRQRQTACNHQNSMAAQQESIPTSDLVSAVDIHYGNKIIYSKVDVRATGSSWFKSSPFRLNLLGEKEVVGTPLKFDFEEGTRTARVEKNMIVSWILIDPVKKRALNLSSLRPVVVRQHGSTGEIFLHYSTVIATGVCGGFVKCGVDVTCEGKDGGVLHIRDIGMQVEDIEGKILSGKDTLRILQKAMEGKRVKGQIEEGKKMYEKFMFWREYELSDQFLGKTSWDYQDITP